MRKRNKQKQIWSDPEFVTRLKQIKAQRELIGEPVDNLGDLTKEILGCPSFKELEKELLSKVTKKEMRFKIDKKRLY